MTLKPLGQSHTDAFSYIGLFCYSLSLISCFVSAPLFLACLFCFLLRDKRCRECHHTKNRSEHDSDDAHFSAPWFSSMKTTMSVHAVNVASFAFSVSMVGLMISATPGIASALSNNWLSTEIMGLTNPASTFRCVSDSCPSIPLTLSICEVTSRSFGNAASAEAVSVTLVTVVRRVLRLSVTCLPRSTPPTIRLCAVLTPS